MAIKLSHAASLQDFRRDCQHMLKQFAPSIIQQILEQPVLLPKDAIKLLEFLRDTGYGRPQAKDYDTVVDKEVVTERAAKIVVAQDLLDELAAEDAEYLDADNSPN